MALKAVQFAAIVLAALALVPGGAHFFELPHKIVLTEASYFTVQQIYRGWAFFGIALIGALAADLALVVMLRGRRGPFLAALAGFILMAATLAAFFIWTYPANQATQNWTIAPADWRHWRAQWEYAHAAGAALTFLSFCAVTLSALMTRD